MKKNITATGKTPEDALLNAQRSLGIESLEGFEFKILEMNKKGLFGIGGTPAKVIVYEEGYFEELAAEEAKAAANVQAPKESKPEKEKKAEKKPASAPVSSNVSDDPALAFVIKLLDNLNLKATATVSETEDGELITVSGEDAGVLIGHHGDTLDAFQYLANLAYRRKKDDHKRINVDVENYRAKREDTLRNLARRMAAKVLKYKKSVMLEPMTPYERRIIHSEIQNIEGVSTNSVGSENNRKIVIFLTDKSQKPKER